MQGGVERRRAVALAEDELVAMGEPHLVQIHQDVDVGEARAEVAGARVEVHAQELAAHREGRLAQRAEQRRIAHARTGRMLLRWPSATSSGFESSQRMVA